MIDELKGLEIYELTTLLIDVINKKNKKYTLREALDAVLEKMDHMVNSDGVYYNWNKWIYSQIYPDFIKSELKYEEILTEEDLMDMFFIKKNMRILTPGLLIQKWQIIGILIKVNLMMK